MSTTPTPATAQLTQEQRDATLITTDRKRVTVGELLGRPLVLAFFPAAFTSVCTKEMCTFRDSMARFNSLDAAVYGISIDTPFTLGVFGERHGLTFPLLSDANREATRAFGVTWPDLSGVRDVSNRAVFVLDASGHVVYRWVGENPGQEPPYDDVLAAVEQAR
jgi:peroxiredoxin